MTFTIDPRLPLHHVGSAARTWWKAPFTFTAITSSHSASRGLEDVLGEDDGGVVDQDVEADRRRSSARRTAASAVALARARRRGRAITIAEAASSLDAASMSSATTEAPSSSSSSTVALPSPPAAPVTMATRPRRRFPRSASRASSA